MSTTNLQQRLNVLLGYILQGTIGRTQGASAQWQTDRVMIA